MNSLVTFNFKSTPVRTETIENQVWFCLIDVCDSLALKRKSNWLSRLAEDGLRKMQLIDNLGRSQETTFINEPNLYRLIFRSNKPAALQFAKWVYEEVLPTIRQTGSYGVPTAQVDMKAIGGMVKKCAAVAVREEISKLITSSSENVEPWEVSDIDLIRVLYDWHCTRNKADVVKMQELIRQNEEYKRRLSAVKQAVI